MAGNKKPHKLTQLYSDNEQMRNPKTDDAEIQMPDEDIMGYRESDDFEYRQDGQYMFWTITVKRGKLPRELEGQWMSLYDAEKAVKVFLNKVT